MAEKNNLPELRNGHRTGDLADDSTPVSTAQMGTLIAEAI